MNTIASSRLSTGATPLSRLATTTQDDGGKLVLRVALGVMVLLHGIFKLSAGVGFIGGMLATAGLPGGLAYLVYVGEIVAPLMIIAGVFTRAAAAVVVINMLVAFSLVHMGDLFALGKQGGWALELQGMYLFGALAVALMGAGRWSVGGRNGLFN